VIASSGHRPPESIDELISPALAAALDQLDVSSRKLFPGKLQGERRSKARGKSVEFEDYRQYATGDDLRHIDWNVLARLDRFFIRVFQEEQDLSLHIVLDASLSMDAGASAARGDAPAILSKLAFGQRLAMALGYLGLVNNNRVEMTIFGGPSNSVARLEPLRSRRSVQALGRFLMDWGREAPRAAMSGSESRGESFSSVLKAVAARRTGRGVVMIISDMLIPPPEGYQPGLGLVASMAASGAWDALVLQVLSPGEIDPAHERDGYGGPVVLGDLRLTDVETGRVSEVTVSADLLKRYRARFASYQSELAEFCTRRGLTHQLVPTSSDITTLLLSDLRKRGVIG
jgi:Protein of unknown function DUF58